MRANDVSWKQVYECLSALLHDRVLEQEVAPVAVDLRDAIDERIVLAAPDPAALTAFFDRGKSLVSGVAAQIAGGIASADPPRAPAKSADYVSTYVHFDAPDGSQVALWVYLVRKAGNCNRHGQPDSIVVEPRDSNTPFEPTWADRLVPAGFAWVKDIAGWTGCRRFVELEEIQAAGGPVEQAEYVASLALTALAAAGLISSSNAAGGQWPLHEAAKGAEAGSLKRNR